MLAEPRGDLGAAGFGCPASAAPQVFLSLARLARVTAACCRSCFLKACHSPDAVLMGTGNCGE